MERWKDHRRRSIAEDVPTRGQLASDRRRRRSSPRERNRSPSPPPRRTSSSHSRNNVHSNHRDYHPRHPPPKQPDSRRRPESSPPGGHHKRSEGRPRQGEGSYRDHKGRRSKSPLKTGLGQSTKGREEFRNKSPGRGSRDRPFRSQNQRGGTGGGSGTSLSSKSHRDNRERPSVNRTEESHFSKKGSESVDTSRRNRDTAENSSGDYKKRQETKGPSRESSGREKRQPVSRPSSSSSATRGKRSLSLPDSGHSSKKIKVEKEATDTSSGAKNSLSPTHSDDDLEAFNVEKWVRSAPDELYYSRGDNGEFVASDRTKLICEKFEKKLLVRAQTARLEAERLGEEKLVELTIKDNLEILEQREERRLRRKKKKEGCHHKETCSKTPEDKVQEESCKRDACPYEEGEICDSPDVPSVEPKPSNDKESCDMAVKAVSQNGSKCNGVGVTENKNNCKTRCDKDSKTKSSPTSKKKGDEKKKRGRNESSSSSSSSSDSSDSDSSDEECGMSRSDAANRELEKKKKHPRRMHVELWHNDPGLMNDGPVCRCSAKARRFGIRHGFYPGESPIPLCDPFSTNSDRLVHYRITISPPKNFLVKTQSLIAHDGHEYIFEGFSLFSHYKVDLKLPPCKVIRFNIRYDVFVTEEKFPESFCVKELQLFETYVFREILELLDLKYDWNEEGSCNPFHLMPRFVRQLPDNGKEILSMNRVLLHLIKSDKEVMREEDLSSHFTKEQSEWQNFADKHKGMIVTKFGQKPSSIRVDQIDRDVSGQEEDLEDGIPFPLIVHFGIRPPQLSYAGNASYQRAWRRYVKYRHLLSNMAKPTAEEKRKLVKKEMKLQEMRTASSMKRDVTVAISCKGFRTTGIFCDLVQHAMLIPVLVAHLRFHKALSTLESTMIYEFKNRYLLQLAMTHPSYRENFGTNPDHARNALTNCGIRQPEYGDRRIHYASTRKRGINTLINIMAKFGSDHEMESEITHNERLEFLGDAVVEFVTSIHLFHLFPDLEEGGLATYRAAIVQNQHLAVLAQTLNLDQYMLYAHGSDLCHDSELRHAMANCFEALMGALFLDGGIEVADRVFGTTLYGSDPELHNLWTNYSRHPLQTQEPNGDRHWIESHTALQQLTQFEENIGVEFTHIRLLARAFTDRSLGYNNLSCGSNQRLEFLGDTVLQLISSEYLYRHFPDHHEGHLSLLRSSLVNNRTQAIVCDDLGMTQYAMRGDPKSEMKTKDRADLLEAFLGALYIDKGLPHCTVFCSVCFFPRLNKSIIKQEWNDPKSKLQQCCLTLRAMDGREPDIPVYKVTQSLGPTNTRIYIVAVYFRSKRLATAKGHSIQEAEMNAAAVALQESGYLFPQLHHQRSVMDKTSKKIRHR